MTLSYSFFSTDHLFYFHYTLVYFFKTHNDSFENVFNENVPISSNHFQM